jgi:pSer/pThr/pTyr-binding forkhead associated (FHA) protein
MKFCPKDRYVMPDDATRCKGCGFEFVTIEAKKKDKPAPSKPRETPILGSLTTMAPALVRILEGQGGDTYWLQSEEMVIGRTQGLILFPGDEQMAKSHASIHAEGTQCFLRDLRSRNGTFIKRAGRYQIYGAMECLIGQCHLVWTERKSGGGWDVAVYKREWRSPRAFPAEPGVTIGSAGADIELDDKYVSAVHAEIKEVGKELYLVDLNSVNGIYYRIPAERNEVLEPSDMFRAGLQVFRFELLPR